MKTFCKIIFISLLIISCSSNDNDINTSQTSHSIDPTFFPQFVAHAQNPIIEWADFIVGSWADPTVLKVNNDYIMYVSAMHGGISTPQPILSLIHI